MELVLDLVLGLHGNLGPCKAAATEGIRLAAPRFLDEPLAEAAG
jgi:hypothetical protein